MSEKFSGEEVSKRALDILQSSDFNKTLESFNAKCIKPTMNIMAKKIVKAKKKLKKLQKRQREQDKQGVVSVDNGINAPVITERLDVSERPIVCDDGMKPRIINTMTIGDFIKWRDKMARPS